MPGLKKQPDARREELVQAAFAVAVEEGLEHVTGRKVAAKAGLSSGLIFFHFESRDALLEAVLDRLVERIFGDFTPPQGERAGDRLVAFLKARIERQQRERREMELFIDFWVLGVRQPAIRKKLKVTLARYRGVVQPLVSEGAAKDAEALAQVTVSFILGCALQAVVDGQHFDVARYVDAVAGLLAAPKAAPKAASRRGRS
jgi:AcrR family transcriptional regulator